MVVRTVGRVNGILTLLVLAGVVAGAALVLAALLPAGSRLRPAAAVALVPALALVAAITLTPTGYADAAVNLDPGAGLTAPWRSGVSAVNILGNLLLFVPVGVLLPACLPWLRRAVPLALAAAAGSVLIEITQYALVPGRASDVNDVLLNTAGALAGLAALRAVHGRHDRAATPARRPTHPGPAVRPG